MNIRNYYLSTKVGKFSMKISDTFHYAGIDFWKWLAVKSDIMHFKRRFVYPLTFIGGFIYGYVFVSYLYGKNIVENSFNMPSS
tara:strand:+ start:145 stop:393 length:249 start_codon:yes stop_codon:yes gene_type:complete